MLDAQLLQQLPKDNFSKLWFLFEQKEFFTFRHIQNLITAIRFVQQTTEDDFAVDENQNIIRLISNIPIEYEFEISENGDEKIKACVLEGINLLTISIFKNDTIIDNNLLETKEVIPSNDVLNLLENWLVILKNATKTALKQQFGEIEQRITKLLAISQPNNSEKFELQVLTFLQKCDTAAEFDALTEKTAIVAPDSNLTKQLLALIANKRKLYQL